MRPPLTARYDPTLLNERYAGAEGSAQLRNRAFFILRTAAGGLVAAAAAAASDGASAAPSLNRALEELGPTAIKFGQAAANRPDLVGRRLADNLRLLQDSVTPFSTAVARKIIREDLGSAADEILAALPEEPVAAASIGQVYRLSLPSSHDDIALKVLRPEVRETVALDALLARRAAGWLETLRWPPTGEGTRLIKPALVASVDEFFSRLWEETDYANEIANLQEFGALYGRGGRASRALGRSAARRGRRRLPAAVGGEICVPLALPALSRGRVLSMTWIEGAPLLRRGEASLPLSELPLVRFGIDATLCQMLEEGVMHADPHGGNLLRAPPRQPSRASRALRWLGRRPPPPPRLAYLDFGLVSHVPLQVREGLVCAVAQLLFARDYASVAGLFDELMLLPASELASPTTKRELETALAQLAQRVLVEPSPSTAEPPAPTAELPLLMASSTAERAPDDAATSHTPTVVGRALAGGPDDPGTDASAVASAVASAAREDAVPPLPTLEFGALITELALLAPRFALQLPPYFLNNARALATLEGMARSADPDFDVLQAVYPFALTRLLSDPRGSPLLRATLKKLTRDPTNGRIDMGRVRRLLNEAAVRSGRPRRAIVLDALRTPGGRSLALEVAAAQIGRPLAWVRRRVLGRPRTV